MKMGIFLKFFAVFGLLAANCYSQVGISGEDRIPDSSAMLDVYSVSKGVLIPRMTYDQRSAINNPEEGLMVFCTDCGLNGAGALSIRTRGTWITFSICNSPSPAEGSHQAYSNAIVWSWNSVAGAAGYKWNTSSSFSTAIDMGTKTWRLEAGLNCTTQYTRYIWACFPCGVSTPALLTHSTASCFACGSSVVPDEDLNIYTTVQIGNQCWMVENLKTTHYRNGDSIPNVTVNNDWCALTTGAYAWYNNNAGSYKNVYGALYNFYTTVDTRILCPESWHVPTSDEMDTLWAKAGGVSFSGMLLKETGTAHWAPPNPASNIYGFTGLPGGDREVVSHIGAFSDLTFSGYLWTSTASSDFSASTLLLKYDIPFSYRQDHWKKDGYSVRCLKD
jgi:uncharacterized protein (TIGR02145 family)